MMAVTFTKAGRLYYLDPGEHAPRVGDTVLFPTSTSPEVCQVVWGPEWVEDAQTLRVHVSHLRKKIEPSPAGPRYIVTEPGVGFRLSVPDAAETSST